MSMVVAQAELMLAPFKVQVAFESTGAGVAQFVVEHKRRPSAEAIDLCILAALVELDASRDEVQWLIDAQFMAPEFMARWEEAVA